MREATHRHSIMHNVHPIYSLAKYLIRDKLALTNVSVNNAFTDARQTLVLVRRL